VRSWSRFVDVIDRSVFRESFPLLRARHQLWPSGEEWHQLGGWHYSTTDLPVLPLKENRGDRRSTHAGVEKFNRVSLRARNSSFSAEIVIDVECAGFRWRCPAKRRGARRGRWRSRLSIGPLALPMQISLGATPAHSL